MSKLTFSGPLRYRLRSFAALNRIAISTFARHAFGKRMAPDWPAAIEIGIRFWRHQFTVALRHPDIVQGRLLFDSVVTETSEIYDVDRHPSHSPAGEWFRPRTAHSAATLLYLHGGGYTFRSRISERFAAMLAHHTGANLFMPHYRLTPEHPHPAQVEDALTAWAHVTAETPADRIVVIGDSAGGHLSLMLLQALKQRDGQQPALCVGLCPWTDIGARGDSLTDNDRYDLVQGWMALLFGTWLDPDKRFGREALSPIFHDFACLAPIYLQVGGREVLRDMILEFAKIQTAKGASVTLDHWPDMPHDFQAYDSLMASSAQALSRLVDVIEEAVPTSGQSGFPA